MKSAVKIINVIITIGTIYVAIIAAIFVLPRAFGLMPYVVLSGSMEPSIPTGSVAFIDQKDRDVEIGDVVTYRIGSEASIETGEGTFASAEEGTLVTHRIVSMTATGNYITKGDANEVEDVIELNPVQIVGTYKFNIPRLGSLMLKINTRTMTMILIGLVVMNIVTSLLSWAWEDENNKEENNDDSAKEENKESEENDSDKKEDTESEKNNDSDKEKDEESKNDDDSNEKIEESENNDTSEIVESENDDSNPQEKSEENEQLNKEKIESEKDDSLNNGEDSDLNKKEPEENHDVKEEVELEKTEENENGDKKEEDYVEDKTEDLSKIKIEGKEENIEEKVEENKEEIIDGKNPSIVNI